MIHLTELVKAFGQLGVDWGLFLLCLIVLVSKLRKPKN